VFLCISPARVKHVNAPQYMFDDACLVCLLAVEVNLTELVSLPTASLRMDCDRTVELPLQQL
jgi:hypothetical protein